MRYQAIASSVAVFTASVVLFAPWAHVARADEKQGHQGSPLISRDQLQAKLNDPKIRILDARARADYDQGHIPGAVWVDLKALQALTRPQSLNDAASWSQALSPLGISGDVESIYIYDSARQHDAARVWWSLSYAGVPNVGLINGGFELWRKENRPLSTETPKLATRSEFQPSFRAERLAKREEVRQALNKGDAQLLDAREAAQYTGEAKPKNEKAVAGHIAHARHLDGYSLVDADGQFVDDDQLRRQFREAGFSHDQPVIAYSQSGSRSAIVVFALERIGVKSRHYLPGWAEWSRQEKDSIAVGRESTTDRNAAKVGKPIQ